MLCLVILNESLLLVIRLRFISCSWSLFFCPNSDGELNRVWKIFPCRTINGRFKQIIYPQLSQTPASCHPHMQLWRRGGASIIDFLSTVNETNCVVLACFACFQIPSALVGAPEDLQEDEGFPEGSLNDVHVLLRGASLSWERCHRLSDHEWWNCFSRWDGFCSSVEKDFRRDFLFYFEKFGIRFRNRK